VDNILTKHHERQYDVVVVGAGFTGLTAAFELSRQGLSVAVIESDTVPGGLAGSFKFSDGVEIEKFYHHWFNNDQFVRKFVKDLGLEDDLLTLPSKTGIYLGGRIWKLSTPLDLLRFSALPLLDRIRLGLMVFQVRRVTNWRAIEHLNIREWLESLCGKNVYRVVWEPLVASKFSVYAEDVNAVWMWKKLVLRGSTRDKKGGEELLYLKGGFGHLVKTIVSAIQKNNGDIRLGAAVTAARTEGDRVLALRTQEQEVTGRHFLFTPAPPLIADMFTGVANPDWLARLRHIRHLGNICLVLRLKRPLSSTYWLNVNDPGFPFVGVIEHTNLDTPSNYGNTHVIFLSCYLSDEDPKWNYSEDEYFQFALEHLMRMFPTLNQSDVLEYRVWRARFGQPVTDRNYSEHIPSFETPFINASISTMAQIYPEDRGTNYAIREGQAAAARISRLLRTA
jgi:protoporphyrinogen oxidase